jgi:hypothetical protein
LQEGLLLTFWLSLVVVLVEVAVQETLFLLEVEAQVGIELPLEHLAVVRQQNLN